MNLNSVPKPDTEVAAPPPRALRETVQIQAPVTAAPGAVTLARLATGQSDQSLAAGGALESIIGDKDERQPIKTTRDAPFRMICALEIDAPWGTFVGTGWLVGPRTIITAGHCVFDAQQMGGWARRITVSAGRDGSETPFSSFTATRFSTTDRWQQDQDPDFDMAAIHVEAGDAFPETHGWFSVASFPNETLVDTMVNISGYPADKSSGTEQWWAQNRIRAVTPRRLFYDVDTMGGQSGAPAYIVAKGAPPVVVGIHAYGTGGTPAELRGEFNSAPRIIPEVVDLISGWRKADDAA